MESYIFVVGPRQLEYLKQLPAFKDYPFIEPTYKPLVQDTVVGSEEYDTYVKGIFKEGGEENGTT